MMNPRLEELVSVFASNPRTAFADGGPDLDPLPWDGLSWKSEEDIRKRSYTFELFGTSLVLRDHRFPAGLEKAPTGEAATVFSGGMNDRVLDGLLITWGGKALSSPAEAKRAVADNPEGGAALLFAQIKMSGRILDEDVERFGGNVQGFLTEPDYLRARTSDQIKKHRAIYDTLRNSVGRSLAPDVTLVFAFHGKRGDFHVIKQVRNRVLTNLGNSLPQARFGMEIWDEDDICQAAMLAGIGIKRTFKNIRSMAFGEGPGVRGYVAILPGRAIVEAFAPAGTNPGAAEVVLDPQFFLENPRHDRGEGTLDNAGANAMSNSIRKGRQSQAFLCHNGLTIVARRVEADGDGIALTTPQVVNGCQTSYALGRLNGQLDGTTFLAKLIQTEDEPLKDAIVLGANTQEEIATWDLLSRRRFVRELERDFDRNWKNRLYLERRQGWRDVWRDAEGRLPNELILTPRQLMEAFASAILGRAHLAHEGPARVLPLVHEINERGKAAGQIFLDEHEPALYRAVGWLVAAGRMWGQSTQNHWNDHYDAGHGYRYRHQFVGALWRIADAEPDRVAAEDLARGRRVYDRAEGLLARLADRASRNDLTARADTAVSTAFDGARARFAELKTAGRLKAKDMPDPRKQAWFTELVSAEADKLRV